MKPSNDNKNVIILMICLIFFYFFASRLEMPPAVGGMEKIISNQLSKFHYKKRPRGHDGKQ